MTNLRDKKSGKILALLLCCVMLSASLAVFAACGTSNDYNSFEEAQTAAASEGKAILLYISKKPCPYCDQFKSEWLDAKNQYGAKVIFYMTTINKDREAPGIYEKYAHEGPGVLSGSPGLVWLNKDGVVIDKTTNLTQCKSKIWGYFEKGLEGWWTNADI